MQKYLFAVCFLLNFLFIEELKAGSAGLIYSYETQEIVLFPSAGLAGNKQLINFDFVGKDILIASFETMLFKDVSIGSSIAFKGLLGNNNKFGIESYPAIKIKYRFLNEGKYYPAMMIGFDSQNLINIPINKTQNFHHLIGPFIVLSKAFSWQFGLVAVHFGANFPVDNNSNKRGNVFMGLEHTISSLSSIATEYDFNGAYNKDGNIENGIFNIGLKYSIDRNVTLQFYLIDLFSKNFDTYKVFKLQFISNFF